MPELATLLPMLLALVVIGGLAGVIGGLLGVGGGIVLVPAFFYAFSALGYGGDQLMQVCVATSLATIVVTSLRSVSAHNRKGAVDWSVLRTWGPWLVISAGIGVFVAAQVPSAALQAVFGVLAGLAGLWMAFGRDSARWAKRCRKSRPGPAGGQHRVLLGPDGDRRGHLRGAADDAVRNADPPGGRHGLGLRRADRGAAVLGFLLVRIEDAPPLTVGAVNLPAFAVVIGTTAPDHTLGRASGPCHEPPAAEAGLCGLSDAGGAEHAAEGAVVGDRGWQRIGPDPRIAAWAAAALPVARAAVRASAEEWRCGGTWFVGVDALPNGPEGQVGGAPFPWAALPLAPEPCTGRSFRSSARAIRSPGRARTSPPSGSGSDGTRPILTGSCRSAPKGAAW